MRTELWAVESRLEGSIRAELSVAKLDLATDKHMSKLNDKLDKLDEQSQALASQIRTFERSAGYLVIAVILWGLTSWIFN